MFECSLGAPAQEHDVLWGTPEQEPVQRPGRGSSAGCPVAGLGAGAAALAALRAARLSGYETPTPSPSRYHICIALKAEAELQLTEGLQLPGPPGQQALLRVLVPPYWTRIDISCGDRAQFPSKTFPLLNLASEVVKLIRQPNWFMCFLVFSSHFTSMATCEGELQRWQHAGVLHAEARAMRR